ncbi:FAD binding domain-containing protein [Penicillium longicatenatum]|nr:FAD binding domain-containing protein [Penicillium longicatenatum]
MWSWGRIATVGDNSPKLTPNTGQDRNNAIGSAAALANQLQSLHDEASTTSQKIKSALRKWQEKPQARVNATMKEATMKEATMKEAAMKEAAMKEAAMKEAAMKEAAMVSHLQALDHDCSETLRPVRGVINGAMVLDDTVLERIIFEQWSNAVRPKINSSWNIHTYLPNLTLLCYHLSLL